MITDKEDEELILRVLAGDESGLRRLMERHARRLFFIAKQVLGSFNSDENAEEVVQETFVKIWQQSLKYKSELGTVSNWINQIAKYEALMRRRKAISDSSRQVKLKENMNQIETEDSIFEHMTNEEQAQRIKKILRKLDNKEALIIEMRYFKDLSPSEIAAKLDISPNLARVRVYRALRKMREYMLNESY